MFENHRANQSSACVRLYTHTFTSPRSKWYAGRRDVDDIRGKEIDGRGLGKGIQRKVSI